MVQSTLTDAAIEVVVPTVAGVGLSASNTSMVGTAHTEATVARGTVASSRTDASAPTPETPPTVAGATEALALYVRDGTSDVVATVAGVAVASLTTRMVTAGMDVVVDAVAGPVFGLVATVEPMVEVMPTDGRATTGSTRRATGPIDTGKAIVVSHTLVGPSTATDPTAPTPATVAGVNVAVAVSDTDPTAEDVATVAGSATALMPIDGMTSG